VSAAGFVVFSGAIMSLKDKITDDMKAAMRAKEADRLSAIRMLLAAMKQREVDERIELTDAHILALVEKQVKQRRESITQFELAGRQELADKEKFEIEVLSAYLPQAASPEEISAAIDAAIAEVKPAGPQDMGKVMAILKAKLAGRADMGQLSGQIKARLTA
jgi:uncharacterized protein YqeY